MNTYETPELTWACRYGAQYEAGKSDKLCVEGGVVKGKKAAAAGKALLVVSKTSPTQLPAISQHCKVE